MHARERVIRERFATQTCSACGWPFSPRSVVVLARRGSTWMVLVTCNECNRRGIFVVSFPSTQGRPTEADHLGQAASTAGQLRTDAASAREASTPTVVTDTDVERIHEFLATFDGDFQRIFAGPSMPPQPS